MDMSEFENELMVWHDRKYGRTDIDVPKTMRKLGEEYGEFIEAVMTGNPEHIAEEAADVFFVMTHIVRHCVGVGKLNQAATEKLVELDRRLKLSA